MTWSEAFSRAGGGVLALIGVYIAAFITLAIGGGLLSQDSGITTLFGGQFMLAGFVMLLLGALAVTIKVLTDSVTDNIMSRVNSLTRLQAQPAARSTATRSPARPRTTAASSTPRTEASTSRPSPAVARGSSSPRGTIVLSPNPPYFVNTRGGEGLAVEIKNIGDAPWMIARLNGNSPLTDGIVVERAEGKGETTINFSWEGESGVTRREPFSFNLKVGEGQEARVKTIVVMAEPR